MTALVFKSQNHNLNTVTTCTLFVAHLMFGQYFNILFTFCYFSQLAFYIDLPLQIKQSKKNHPDIPSISVVPFLIHLVTKMVEKNLRKKTNNQTPYYIIYYARVILTY